MSKVFITSKSHHDFSPAEKYGKLIFVSDGRIGKFNVGTMFRAAKRALATSSPDDFILITGQSIVSSLVCSMFSAKHQKLNLLLYCGTENRYITRRIVF